MQTGFASLYDKLAQACSEEPDLCTVDATALNPGNILRKQVQIG